MHFGFRNSHYDYSMKGQQLEAVSSERDLGVIIASSLKVADHCQHAYSMANRMLGLVSRSIKHRDVGIMVQLHKSVVRPHLEYSTVVWNPHYSKDKVLLEKVQRRFTWLFADLRRLNYYQRLAVLKLWSLKERRHRADLVELFKMAKGLSGVSLSSFFKLAVSNTRGHTWKLATNTDIRLHFSSSCVLN